MNCTCNSGPYPYQVCHELHEYVREDKTVVDQYSITDNGQFQRGHYPTSITALIFAIGMDFPNDIDRIVVVMTYEGYGLIVQIPKAHWHMWDALKIGDVISLHGRMTHRAGSTKMSASSAPLLISRSALSFKMMPLPADPNYNCCIIAVVERIVEKRVGAYSCAPEKVVCKTSNDEKFVLIGFDSDQKNVMKNLEPGETIHIGACSYDEEQYANVFYNNVYCHRDSVIQSLGNSV